MAVVEIQISPAQLDYERARRNLGNSGHIKREMGGLLTESARIGEQSAKIFAPKKRGGIVEAISSTPARDFTPGAQEATVGVSRASGAGMTLGAEGDQTAYPFYVHEGTGLFGALSHLIRSVRAKAMRWIGPTGLVFAKTTKGQKPQPYIGEAFEELEHYIPQRIDLMVDRILRG